MVDTADIGLWRIDSRGASSSGVASVVSVPRARPVWATCRRRGVALVDALVGSILLGAALAAIIGLAARAIGLQSRGEELQVAAMLLDEHLNLVLARGPDDYERSFDVEGPCEAPYGGFRYNLVFSGGQGGDPYRVRATVTWSSGGRTRSESIETLMAPRRGEDPDPQRRPEDPVLRE